jgi:arylamine N-acetyltransferase
MNSVPHLPILVAVRLDDDTLFRKLVTERRGGYGFEQNGLLLGVLRQLGFEVVRSRSVWLFRET